MHLQDIPCRLDDQHGGLACNGGDLDIITTRPVDPSPQRVKSGRNANGEFTIASKLANRYTINIDPVAPSPVPPAARGSPNHQVRPRIHVCHEPMMAPDESTVIVRRGGHC